MVIREQRFSFNHVRQVLGGVLDHDLHAKRVDSLCDATLGVLRSASLAVCMIGQGLAAARGLNPKHATKQVDRLLSNPMINVDDILARWGIVTLSSSGRRCPHRGAFARIMLPAGRKHPVSSHGMPESGSHDRRWRQVGDDVDESGRR
jgi:hypothetical protein